MQRAEPSTRRIARNTLMLYLRTLLSVVVGLYTSREVLQTLGIEDYGIYGLVGGIVSMLGFLNTSMAGATSRFITYDLEVDNAENLKRTFNAAFQSHLIVAFIVVLFAETIGLWFVNNYLDIPQDRFFATNCIYQLSILSAVVGITQTPYSAVILAHEQMDVYAWLEILNAVLKLFIVWLLLLACFDKLIFYGALSFAVTVLIRSIYLFYCHRNFSEYHLNFEWHPKILRRMLSFSGWNIYYEASETVRLQGINILINRFFGVVLNASCGLASMVQGTCWILGHNIIAAFRPQIIKQYAVSNYTRMQQFMNQALKFTLIIISLLFIPAIVEMPYLLHLWLGLLPPFVVAFCRIYLLDTFFGLINHIFNIGISAQGNVKAISIVSGTLKFLCLPLIYILFYFSFSPACAYWCNLFCLMIIVVADCFILKSNVPHLHIRSLLLTCLLAFSIILGCSVVYICFRYTLPVGFQYKVFAAFSFVALCALLSYLFLLDVSEKRVLHLYLFRKMRR